ncbi:MAG: ATP-dependent zinc metalloprotease FtsH [Ruminococcaceae bacterium]|nr:ATP-dependent zinc metalloprotease FtsH [Oscillospiraceae bacterium]
MKVNFKSIIMLVLIVVAVIFAVTFITQNMKDSKELSYGKVIEKFENDDVLYFKIDGDFNLIMHVRKPLPGGGYEQKEVNGIYEYVPEIYEFKLSLVSQVDDILELARGNNNLEDFDIERAAETPWYVAYLPYIIIALIFIGLWFFIMRQAPGGGGKINSFSKSKTKVTLNDKDAVKFADVAGADEEKAELEEVVEFLKDPTKFVKLGARIPRGVLLVGPPGTGKTLLAKAVAGEAGVPFFSISGSDFVEMYVGVGASRVRDLFDSARKTPASIIFIDEIDAVGRHRGAGLGGGHDEREQTLNQLLVEMDGFGTNSGVIVMAATNRPDILDPALLRPGRFDRRVTVNYPDMKGREDILKVHCRNKPLEESVDLKKIAQTTIGFTGAELANLMNEAALRAAKKNKALIGMEDIEESYMKLLLGPQKKKNMRTEADNKLCAYHEAGHAVASYFCKNTDPVKHITIIPAGSAGGVTISVPTEDRMVTSRNEMLDRIVLSLGGRVAEEIVLDDISTGASNDIQQATAIARNMVTRYGMSKKLGTVLYGSEHSADEVFLGRDFSSGKNYSEQTASEIDAEIRDIISDCYEICKKHLSENIGKLHFVAEFLLKNESMDDEQFKAAMESENPTIEEIEQIAADKKRKSEEENKTAHANNEKAEEEARRKAEEEAKMRLEEAEKAGKFPVDDFFTSVFAVPKEEPKAPETDGESDSDSSDTATDVPSDTETAQSDENNEKQ